MKKARRNNADNMMKILLTTKSSPRKAQRLLINNCTRGTLMSLILLPCTLPSTKDIDTDTTRNQTWPRELRPCDPLDGKDHLDLDLDLGPDQGVLD